MLSPNVNTPETCDTEQTEFHKVEIYLHTHSHTLTYISLYEIYMLDYFTHICIFVVVLVYVISFLNFYVHSIPLHSLHTMTFAIIQTHLHSNTDKIFIGSDKIVEIH